MRPRAAHARLLWGPCRCLLHGRQRAAPIRSGPAGQQVQRCLQGRPQAALCAACAGLVRLSAAAQSCEAGLLCLGAESKHWPAEDQPTSAVTAVQARQRMDWHSSAAEMGLVCRLTWVQ